MNQGPTLQERNTQPLTQTEIAQAIGRPLLVEELTKEQRLEAERFRYVEDGPFAD